MALSTANTVLQYGIKQVETLTVVGTITQAGNAKFIIESVDMTPSDLMLDVPVALGDTAIVVVGKIKAVIEANADIALVFDVIYNGTDIVFKQKTPTGNEPPLNLIILNDTCTGLVDDGSSSNTTTGVAYTKLVDIIDYPDLGASPSKLDKTTLTDTKFKTNILGLQEAPDFTFTANYDKTVYLAIKALCNKELCFRVLFGVNGVNGIATWNGELDVYTTGGGVDETRKMTIVCSSETEIIFA